MGTTTAGKLTDTRATTATIAAVRLHSEDSNTAQPCSIQLFGFYSHSKNLFGDHQDSLICSDPQAVFDFPLTSTQQTHDFNLTELNSYTSGISMKIHTEIIVGSEFFGWGGGQRNN